MIPLNVLKESPTYQFFVDQDKDSWKEEGKLEGKLEGRLEGKMEGKLEGKMEGKLEALADLLQLLIARRFPKLKVKAKIKQIHDAALLQQLNLEVIEIADPTALRKRLDEAVKAQKSELPNLS